MATSARAVSDRRRQVFKHVLEKPYTTNWPAASQAVQSEVVDLLCTALKPLATYFGESRRMAKRRKTKSGKQESLSSDALVGKEILKHVVIGINSTTRALERQARRSQPLAGEDLALVVVCKGDVEPQLVAHFPGLAHAARVAKVDGEIQRAMKLRLMGVGAGSEKQLAVAVGQPRVSTIGIRTGMPALDAVVERAYTEVAAPSVPWIGTGQQLMPPLHPMKVRELHTTAPVANKRSKKTK
ncbi:RNase P and RNase MRP subunit [Coemansia sp. RSA 2610]|nr:RNase P and RNase MRP subunit [Coemansia sp. RSA 2610]